MEVLTRHKVDGEMVQQSELFQAMAEDNMGGHESLVYEVMIQVIIDASKTRFHSTTRDFKRDRSYSNRKPQQCLQNDRFLLLRVDRAQPGYNSCMNFPLLKDQLL